MSKCFFLTVMLFLPFILVILVQSDSCRSGCGANGVRAVAPRAVVHRLDAAGARTVDGVAEDRSRRRRERSLESASDGRLRVVRACAVHPHAA